MNRILVTIITAICLCGPSLWAGNDAKQKSRRPEPTVIQAIDTEANTITIGRTGGESTTYTFDKKFVMVQINGARADLSKLEIGMKVGVTASGNRANRIDAQTMTSRTDAKQK